MTETTDLQPAPAAESSTPSLPLNRIVAFAGPYIAIASGAVADWLLVHVHLLALFHTTHTAIASWLTQATVFGLTALLVWLGQQKWLTGWIELGAAGVAAVGKGKTIERQPTTTTTTEEP